MSYDFYLWRAPQPVTAEQAAAICRRLAEGHDDAVAPDDAVLTFHRDLIARFPPLNTLSDDELEASPWNMSPDATASRVILSVGHSRVPHVGPSVGDLAAEHRLVCFDPQ